MAAVREDLKAFAAELFDGFFRADQRRWGQAYVRGLLLDGRRKSVEPMAARLGEDGNRQALAHFVTTSPWDPAHVRARLAWQMHETIGPEALTAGLWRSYSPRARPVTRPPSPTSWPDFAFPAAVDDRVRDRTSSWRTGRTPPARSATTCASAASAR